MADSKVIFNNVTRRWDRVTQYKFKPVMDKNPSFVPVPLSKQVLKPVKSFISFYKSPFKMGTIKAQERFHRREKAQRDRILSARMCPETYQQYVSRIKKTQKILGFIPSSERAIFRNARRDAHRAHNNLLSSHVDRKINKIYSSLCEPISNWVSKSAVATSLKQQKVKASVFSKSRSSDMAQSKPSSEIFCSKPIVEPLTRREKRVIFSSFSKDQRQSVRDQIWVERINSLNTEAPGFVGLATYLTWIAVRRRFEKASYAQILDVEDYFHSRRAVEVVDHEEVVGQQVPMSQGDEIEKTSHGIENIQIDQKGNVALTTQRETSEPTPPVIRSNGFLPMSSAREPQILQNLTERWMEAGHFEWSIQDIVHSEIDASLPMVLPLTALSNNSSSPNIAPFKVHQFARFDMDVRVQVNSNKFQVGQLQVSWMYSASINNNFSVYDNVYSASQRIHGLISAGSSNDVCLHIPYWALTSAISLKKSEDEARFYSILDLGSLSIKVLNQLRAADGASTTAGVTVWVSLNNIEFIGMKSSSLDSPFEQMSVFETVLGVADNAIKTIDKSYKQLSSLTHCDNPPVSSVPLTVQPMASHSFCAIDGQPFIGEILRAQPLSQTPVVPGSISSDLSIKELCSKWSLIRTANWKATDKREVLLFREYCTPNALTSRIVVKHDKVNTYTPSILAFFSSYFGYWRGELELRFDFIANEFYSGRVGCYIVPGVMNDVKYSDARQSSGVVFDLQEGHQFIVKIPFYSNTPFLKNFFYKLGGDISDNHVPSSVFLYVLNTLKITDNIPNNIDVNVYVRGTPTFEFALLKSPGSCSFLNQEVEILDSNFAYISSDWPEAYAGHSAFAKVGSDYFVVFRYSDLYLSHFNNLDFKRVYKFNDVIKTFNVDKPFRFMWFPYYIGDYNFGRVQYICRLHTYSYARVALCFDNLASAQAYANNPSNDTMKGAIKWIKDIDILHRHLYFDATAAQADAINKKWPTNPSTPYLFSKILNYNLPDIEFDIVAQAQGDEREIQEMPSLNLNKPSLSSSMGSSVFGESIDFVPNMCKRFQYLGCKIVTPQRSLTCLSEITPSLLLSTHPIRRFDPSISAPDNNAREGFISSLASLYAGYRGSMRYRLVLSDWNPSSSNFSVAVVHRYDRSFQYQRPSVDTFVAGNPSYQTLLNSSYSTKLQTTVVNSVVEFEIPFYNMGEYNSLYFPPANANRLISNFMDSGEIWVYITSSANVNLAVDVYYSVADDMQFSCFQGIPEQISLEPLGQGDETEYVESEQGLISGLTNFVKQTARMPQSVNEAATDLGQASQTIGQAVEATTSFWQDSKKTICDTFQSVVSRFSSFSSIFDIVSCVTRVGGFLCSVILQIFYVLVSPSIWSLSIALGSIMCLVVGSSSVASEACKNLILKSIDFLKVYLEPVPSQQSKEGDDLVSNFVSLLWSIVAGSLLVVDKFKKCPVPDFSAMCKSLFFSSSEVFRLHTFGIRFFSDILVLIKRFYNYINKWLSNDYPFYNVISDKQLQSWMIESLAILDMKVSSQPMQDAAWVAKVYSLHAQGSVIAATARASLSALPAQAFTSICSIHRDLSKLVEELKSTNSFAPFRLEPFVIWLHSDKGGTGKSTLATELPNHLGKLFNISPAYFQLTAGQKYFDGLTTEKFVILDDFLATNTQDMGELLGQYLQMVGTGKLQLPRAAVEKKLTFDDFEFIIITSNFSDFSGVNAVKCRDAFERRRHMLIEFDGVNVENISYYVKQQVSSDSYVKVKYSRDGLIDEIKKQATEFRRIKTDLYRKQLNAYYSVLNDVTQTQSVEDYISQFRSRLESTKVFFSDMEWVATWFTRLWEKQAVVEDEQQDLDEAVAALTSSSNQGDEEGAVAAAFELERELAVMKNIEDYAKQKGEENPFAVSEQDRRKSEERSKVKRNGMTVEEMVAAVGEPVQITAKSIFRSHPYANDIHQSDFFFNRDEIVKCPFGNLDGSKGRFSCNCPELEHPLFYHFDLYECDKFSDEIGLTAEEKNNFLWRCTFGLFVSFCHGRPIASWGKCFVENMVHSRLMDRCWSTLWSFLKVDVYDFNKLRFALPRPLHGRVQNLEDHSGWKLVVPDQKNMSIIQRVKQVCGLLPNKIRIAQVVHPFPKDPHTPLSQHVDGNSIANRLRLYIGCKYVKDDEDRAVWLYPWWVAILKGISCVLSILVVLGSFIKLLYNLISFFFSSSSSVVVDNQGLTSGAMHTGKVSTSRVFQARTLLGSNGQGDELAPSELHSLKDLRLIQGKPISGRLQKVVKNVCFLVARTIRDDGTSTLFSHRCLGLFNYKVLACRHYINHFKRILNERRDRVKFFVVRPIVKSGSVMMSQAPFHLDRINVLEYGKNGKRVGDLCVIDFVTLPSMFADIRGQMANQESGLCKQPSHNVLVTFNSDTSMNVSDVKCVWEDTPLEINSSHDGENWEIQDRLVYGIGGPGMCGSFIWNENSIYPLLGFHTAGIGILSGFSEILFRDEFMFPESALSQAECEMEFVEHHFSELEGYYEPVGTLSSGMKPHIPRSTRIIPSLAHGLFNTRTEPAPLAMNDSRLVVNKDPLIVGVNKRLKPMKPFNMLDLRKARDSVLSKFLLVDSICKVEKLSYKEAVEGLRGVPRSESLEMSTSEGYPWIKMRPKDSHNKKWLFNLDCYKDGSLKLVSLDPFLEKVLDVKNGLRINGIVPLTYYTCMLKDARIVKEKVSIPGKTRVFEMSPVDLTIAQRQFQLPFVLTYMNNNMLMENTVGINVNGYEWNELAFKLSSFSSYILAGDYSSYGPKIESRVLKCALDIMKDWSLFQAIKQGVPYKSDDVQAWNTLNVEIVNSPLVCNNAILRPTGGMASGNAATVVINSIVNSLYIRCAYLKLSRVHDPSVSDLSMFDRYVRMFSNGDDLIVSVSEYIVEWFNNQTLTGFFEQHDLVYTNSKKGAINPPYEKLTEVSYLKCNFLPHPNREGYFLAALDKVSIEDCCQWIWKSEIDSMDATVVNCEQACRLAYGHGPAYFNFVRNKIMCFYLCNKICNILPEWDYLDRQVWDFEETIVTVL